MRYFLLLLTLFIEAASLLLAYACGVANFAALFGMFYTQTPATAHSQLVQAASNLGLAHVYLVLEIYGAVIVARLLWPFLDLFRLGTRKPTGREASIIGQALSYFQHVASRQGSRIGLPRWVRVRDAYTMHIAWVGWCLVIDRALIESPYFPALLARELAHNNSPDLVTQFLARLFAPKGCAIGYLVGIGAGMGPLLTWPLWRVFWRKREYAADVYAAQLGLKQPLIAALQTLYLPLDSATRYGIVARDKPYVAERIDRLLQLPVP